MSPRRRVDDAAWTSLRMPSRPPSRRRLLMVASIAATAMVLALSLSVFVYVKGRQQYNATVRNAEVIDFVRTFVTRYTSPDPFNANAYAEGVLKEGTGNFAKLYSDKMNEVVVQVAQAEPGVGTVQEIGIERWNPDNSVNVIAVANMTTTMPDGKKVDSGSRWEITAVKEGDQWKVSDLIQVL